jgi:hemerythrin-like metal-binding protein
MSGTQALVEALAERYRLGHPEIDRQHRAIFAIVARADEGKPGDQLLDDLIAYAGDHFAAEERLAADLGVLEEDHAAAHRRLLDALLAHRHDQAGHDRIIRRFLVDWVEHHIDRDDRDLVRSMQVAIRLRARLGLDDDL